MITKQAARKTEISILNVLLCLIVIFIHLCAEPLGKLSATSFQYAAVYFPWRLSAFVVQGFIFLAGVKLFLNFKEDMSYGRYYFSRFKSILLPYILWVVIYYLYFWLKHYYAFDLFDLLKQIATGKLVSHFYFVIVIVQFYALIPFWRFMVKKLPPFWSVLSSFIIMAAVQLAVARLEFLGYYTGYADRLLLTYLGYFTAGCFIGMHYEKFMRALKKYRFAVLCAFIAFAVLDSTLSYLYAVGIYRYSYLEMIHYLYCICAIMLLLGVFSKFGEKLYSFKAVREIDGASYLIYLSHILVIFVCNDFMTLFGLRDVGGRFAVRAMIVYVVAVGSCVLWKKLIKKLKGV